MKILNIEICLTNTNKRKSDAKNYIVFADFKNYVYDRQSASAFRDFRSLIVDNFVKVRIKIS